MYKRQVLAHAIDLVGSHIYLDKVSVGATIDIMMAAALAEGQTIIENVAKEPHVVDVANFLNSMGANIKGAGTDIIRIKGVRKLHGTEYSIIPDQIEAGTFMCAAAATRGDITVRNVIPKLSLIHIYQQCRGDDRKPEPAVQPGKTGCDHSGADGDRCGSKCDLIVA